MSLPPCYCKHGAPIMAHCTGCCAEREDTWREVVMETARRVAHEPFPDLMGGNEIEEIAREVAKEQGVTIE